MSDQQPGWFLLTGATGLLGRFLLRDLSARGRRVAVLVRSNRSGSAEARVQRLLDDWRFICGADVPSPMVLEGDITSPGLGLSDEAMQWVTTHVVAVVHAAASLSFIQRKDSEEPYASNVNGTRNLLAVCEQACIRHLHHVSTAYVCGLRKGRILESDLDVGQHFGNDYERSKIEAEKAVRAAGFLTQATIYRPSIIVGEMVNGFTSSFHGFYMPLRILQPYFNALSATSMEPGALLSALGMSGQECKNLVPADWVSAVITRIILNPDLHGRTYHLTSSRPTPVSLLYQAFEKIAIELAERSSQEQTAAISSLEPSMLGRVFAEQMEIYRAYWRDDPLFDASETRRAVPDLGSPAIDEATIRRLCQFAIESNFRWPTAERIRCYGSTLNHS